MKQPPQPLYRSIAHIEKRDPLDFMQSFLGEHTTFDINLEKVLPATSVAEANHGFSARAGAAILYAANTSLLAARPLPGHDPADANGNEQDYGYKILAKMAYADYFLGPDQVPGRASVNTLREEVNASVEAQRPGLVGTTLDFDRGPIHIHAHREYDVLLVAYVKLYYKYYHALSTVARGNIFNNLLSQRGKYDDGERYSLNILNVVTIPETENHRLMIQSAKYLTNQLYFQASVAEGSPDHANFDNNRNGDGGSNPPMVNVILRMLNSFLTVDFVEYNARPYQDYTMSALLNLASFSYDDRVRLAARMVLDYVSAKVAVSSQDLRRCTPFRRRNEDQHFGPTMPNGFLGSPLVNNIGTLPYEPDPQIAFYTILAGNTGVLQSPPDPPSVREIAVLAGLPSPPISLKAVAQVFKVSVPFSLRQLSPVPRPKHAPGNYVFEMVHAGLSDYRVPPAILDLFVSRKSRNFYQGFHHFADIGFYVTELYSGSPSYLISAGGNPSFFAYRADIVGVGHPGDSPDLGLAMPTIFLPSVDCRPSPPGFGTTLTDLIQFGRASTDLKTVNLGVASNFACGGPIYLPDAFEPANHVGDPTLVADGNWTFINRGGDGSRPGYYLAIFRVSSNVPPSIDNFGFLEAYDTLLNFPGLTFVQFQAAVKATNPSIVLQFGNDQVNTYITQADHRIQFTLSQHSTIISTSDEPDQSVYTNTFAHGSIINSEQVGVVNSVSSPATGSGLITISNPAVGTITLDMRGRSAAGDPLFGIHHPIRTSETGEVEGAGANQEVWVDSNYPGTAPTAGDFGDPFRTLGNAINAVTVGGTVRIVNVNGPENPPVIYTKRMTLRAAQVPVTLPR
jgi:hypothetical protein